VEYPKSYQEMQRRFSTQESCIEYVASLRWKDGFVCPFCGSKKFWRSKRLLPRVGRVAAHMKRWYLGTYHGGMKIIEVQDYLDEFVFRYNRRTSDSRGLVFHRLVEAAVNSKPKPF